MILSIILTYNKVHLQTSLKNRGERFICKFILDVILWNNL